MILPRSRQIGYGQIPQYTQDVRKFIGFTGCYCGFIKGCAVIAGPHNDLLVGYVTNPEEALGVKIAIPFG